MSKLNSFPLLEMMEQGDCLNSSKPKLTVLSMGLGQDSVTILLLLIFNKEFREKYAPSDIVVIFSDTGNEHELTYKYRDEVVIPLCKEHNIPFFTISNDMGFHGNTWQSLTGHWEIGRATVQTLAFQPTCSHNLKINPQEKFIDKYLSDNYSLPYNNRKKSFLSFAKHYGKINWLIGIASKEESRTMGGQFYIEINGSETLGKTRTLKGSKIFETLDKKRYPISSLNNIEHVMYPDVGHELKFKYNPVYESKWKNQSINTIYPLIDIGMDRQGCQDFIASCDIEVPLPSSCMFCPYGAGYVELLWLHRTYPLSFDKWAEYEQKKLDEYKDDIREVVNHYFIDRDGTRVNIKGCSPEEYLGCEIVSVESFEKIVNHGVSCKMHKDGEKKGAPITLNDLLNTAKEKYGHMSYKELHEYKMSHGHCVSSKY